MQEGVKRAKRDKQENRPVTPDEEERTHTQLQSAPSGPLSPPTASANEIRTAVNTAGRLAVSSSETISHSTARGSGAGATRTSPSPRTWAVHPTETHQVYLDRDREQPPAGEATKQASQEGQNVEPGFYLELGCWIGALRFHQWGYATPQTPELPYHMWEARDGHMVPKTPVEASDTTSTPRTPERTTQ